MNINFNQYVKLLEWVFAQVIGYTDYQKTVDIPRFLERIQDIYDKHGPEWTIKRIKLMRLMVVRYIAGKPIYPKSIKTNRYGLPSILPLMRLLIKKDKVAIKSVMTLLSISKLIKWWPEKADYEPITKVPSTTLNLHIEGLVIGKVLKQKGINLNLPDWKRYHVSYSKGPNGPAVLSSLWELFIIYRDNKELYKDISTLGGDDLNQTMNGLVGTLNFEMVKEWNEEMGVNPSSIRKISYVRDPEGKLRIICIFDYWSQTSLKPLHDIIFNTLRKIPNDCTFVQSKGLKQEGPYFCFDLSNATDRFPAELQAGLLSEFIGEEKAQAWLRIMTKHEVVTPEGDTVLYKAGQPIGAYSSWAVFTLCHHAILQRLSDQEGWETRYSLLGDDIVIHDESLAIKYQDYIESLGVSINKDKSIISDNLIEFAKRHFLDKEEVSAIPLKGLSTCHRHWIETSGLLIDLEKRGLFNYSSRAVKEFFKLYVSSGFATRLERKVRLGIHLSKIRDNHPDSKDESRKFLELVNFDLGCNRFNFSEIYLLEVIAAHHLISIQNSMFSTQEELQDFAILVKSKAYCTLPVECPPINLLLTKSNEIHREGTLLSEIIQDQDWRKIVSLDFEWFPSPNRLLSKKPNRTGANTLVNKLLVFFKQERQQFIQELTSENDAIPPTQDQ